MVFYQILILLVLDILGCCRHWYCISFFNINGSNNTALVYDNLLKCSGTTYPSGTGSMAVYLNANDYVTMYVGNVGIYADSSGLYTTFSGKEVA